jgi:hypothetical protein
VVVKPPLGGVSNDGFVNEIESAIAGNAKPATSNSSNPPYTKLRMIFAFLISIH